MVITYREFIQNVAASDVFRRMDFPIQPGLGLTFPFLSQLADSYEEYKMHACVFEFQSTTSDTVITAGSSLGMGTVLMATNYNVNRSPFTDERSMENYEGCTSKKPSISQVHIVQCKKNTTPTGQLRWVRTGAPLANEDKRLYDIGTFTLATIGQPTTNNGVIGKLWVSYRCELFKPKYVGSIGSNLIQDHFSNNNTITSGYIDIGCFSTSPTAYPNNRWDPNGLRGAGTWITSSDPATRGFDTLNFRPEHQGMTFLVMYVLKGGGAIDQAYFGLAGSNNVTECTDKLMNFTTGYANSTQGAGAVGNLSDCIWSAKFLTVNQNDADGPWNCKFELSSNLIPAAPLTMDLYVIQVNSIPQPQTTV